MIGREKKHKDITEGLLRYSQIIKVMARQNLQDANIYAEPFFAELFNLVYGFNLRCLDTNYPCIDLIDTGNKIIAQVTSNNKKEKLESSLKEETLQKYPSYRFLFILISGEAHRLRTYKYKKPEVIKFDPTEDIYDLTKLLTDIKSLDSNKLELVYNLINKELGVNVDSYGGTSLTEKDLAHYYEERKAELKWSDERAAPSGYMKLYGIRDIVEMGSKKEIEYIDLLNLLLQPVDEVNDEIFSSSRFKVIYGPSNSGLSYLCRMAFQCFLNGKKTEFNNMACFSISEKDMETIDTLREKLTVYGKSIFSNTFNNGLLIIDGLGNLFSDNLENVKQLIGNVSYLSRNIEGLKVIITVRVNEYSFGRFEIPDRKDVVCIQNMMIHPDDEWFCRLMTMPELKIRPESKEIFRTPRWFVSLAKLYNITQRVTEYEVIYHALHEGIGEATAREIDEYNAELAFEIFAKNDRDKDRLYLCTYRCLMNANSFLRIEEHIVGFKSSVVFEYYVASYLFFIFQRIDIEEKDSIREFLQCLSKKELSDKYYYDEYLIEFPDSEEKYTINHELILLFFKNMCLDKISKVQRYIKINSVFAYLWKKELAQSDYFEDGQRAYETAIKNYITLYKLFWKDFPNEMCEIIRCVSKLDTTFLPGITCASGFLSNLEFKSCIFEIIQSSELTTDSGSEEPSEYLCSYKSINNRAEMSHIIIKESIIKKAEFHNTTIRHCEFEKIRVGECVFEDSHIINCSFDEVKIYNASFKGTRVKHATFNGMEVNQGAFEDALYFKEGDYHKLSQEEWRNLGIDFLDNEKTRN